MAFIALCQFVVNYQSSEKVLASLHIPSIPGNATNITIPSQNVINMLENATAVAQNTTDTLQNATSALTNATNMLQNVSGTQISIPTPAVNTNPNVVNTTTVVNSIFDSTLPSLFIIIIFLVIIIPLLADMYISYKRRPKEGVDKENNRVIGMPGLYRSLMTFGVILLVGTVIYYLIALITLNINNSSSPVLQSLVDVLKNLGTILGTALATIIAFYFGVRGAESATEKMAAAKPVRGDKLPPKVTSTLPVDGAVGVTPNSLVQAVFSDAMNRDTINTATFTVKKDGETTPIPGTVTLSPDGRTVVFDSTEDFDKGIKYVATVDIGVHDLAGNALISAKRWSFTVVDTSN